MVDVAGHGVSSAFVTVLIKSHISTILRDHRQHHGKKILDLSAVLDNNAEVDMNVARMGSGKLVDVQGTAEKEPFSKKDLDTLISLASNGIKSIIKLQKKIIGSVK